MMRLRRRIGAWLALRRGRVLLVFPPVEDGHAQLAQLARWTGPAHGAVGAGSGEVAAACAAGALTPADAHAALDGNAAAAGAPRIPLYLGAVGGQVDAGVTLDPAYWDWVRRAPVREGAHAAAIAAGFDVAVTFTDRSRSVARLRRRPHGELEDPVVARDPYAYYETLRADGSVHFLPRQDAWIVLGFDDVQAALAQPRLFSNQPYVPIDPVLLGADPPAQLAPRRLVLRRFSEDRIVQLDAFAHRTAAALLRPRTEAVAGYAAPLSRAVAAQLLGFGDDAVQAIQEARRDSALERFMGTLDALAPTSAVYPELVAGGASVAEATSLVRLLWLAATTTTERAIAHAVLRLLRHPDLEAELRRSPERVPPFVEEVLRLHPPELLLPRRTTEATPLGGVELPPGALVYLSVAAANRDPARFPAPAELRLDRGRVRHLTFGFGVHHCVGAALGRRVVAAAVRTLLGRTHGLRAGQPLSTLHHWCSPTANPVEELWTELDLVDA